MAKLLESAQAEGDPERGADVLASPRFACLSCHKVGDQGGTVGPDLSTVATCLKPEEIVESILWPRRKVKEGFAAVTVATADGKIRQGYEQARTTAELVLRDPATAETVRIARADIEEVRQEGTLMPEGLTESMTDTERRDLVRFLLDLGRPGKEAAGHFARHSAVPASFPYDRDPLQPELWPNWQQPVNRDRIYDFYAKEADYFMHQPSVPALLPPFPGLDGGTQGHWGNQNEKTWADDRWNQTDLGTVLCGVFRGAGVTVPKGVCVRLGEHGELAACFNPETLCYEARLARRVRQVLGDAARVHGRPDHGRHRPAPASQAASPRSRSCITASTGTASASSSPIGSATSSSSTRPGSRTASSRGP